MQVLVFCDFVLKTPIHAPFGVFGAHSPPPKKNSLIVLTPKDRPWAEHVIWAIKHEYRPRGSSWALEEEKRTQHEKSHKTVIFHLFGEKPHWSDLRQKLCSKWRSRHNHVCHVSTFNMKFSGVTILQGVKFSIFLLISEWALQECSTAALPVITVNNLVYFVNLVTEY